MCASCLHDVDENFQLRAFFSLSSRKKSKSKESHATPRTHFNFKFSPIYLVSSICEFSMSCGLLTLVVERASDGNCRQYASDFLSNKSTKERREKRENLIDGDLSEFHKFKIRFLSTSLSILYRIPISRTTEVSAKRESINF